MCVQTQVPAGTPVWRPEVGLRCLPYFPTTSFSSLSLSLAREPHGHLLCPLCQHRAATLRFWVGPEDLNSHFIDKYHCPGPSPAPWLDAVHFVKEALQECELLKCQTSDLFHPVLAFLTCLKVY